jgi:hypothetical protein
VRQLEKNRSSKSKNNGFLGALFPRKQPKTKLKATTDAAQKSNRSEHQPIHRSKPIKQPVAENRFNRFAWPKRNLKKTRQRTIPNPQLLVSTEALIEIEVWAEKARIGKTRNAFGPILDQVIISGHPMKDATHALTLAQIMPYDEISRKLNLYELSMATMTEQDFIYSLAEKYRTSAQNVVDRIAHVKRLAQYYKQNVDDDGFEEM